MTTDVTERKSKDELIAQLDPARDYGERTYEDVVRGVRDGTLRIQQGFRLPVLRDVATNHAIKGTGAPPGAEAGLNSAQQLALRAFRERAYEDLDSAYEWLIAGMKPDSEGKPGDPRYFKIYFDSLLGKVESSRVTDEMGRAFQMLIDKINDAPRSRSVVIDG